MGTNFLANARINDKEIGGDGSIHAGRVMILLPTTLSKRDYLSTCSGVEIHSIIGVVLGITSFGVEIHAQNSGIHSQKSDLNHYFGVDSTILRVDFHSKRSDP